MKPKNEPGQIKAPNLPSLAVKTSLDDFVLEEEATFIQFNVELADFTEVNASFLNLSCGRLNRVRLADTLLKKLRLTDIRMEVCDLSNGSWPATKMNRVEMVECKLTGLKLNELDAANCIFERCVGDHLRFAFSKFVNTVFKDCKFRDVNFDNCDLRGVRFLNCELDNVQLREAQLTGCDFRTSTLHSVTMRLEDWKGAVINSVQATEMGKLFANQLGLDVRD